MRTGKLACLVAEREREVIALTLAQNDWMIARTARALGVSRRSIGYKIVRYNLRGIIAEQRGQLCRKANARVKASVPQLARSAGANL